MSDTNKICPLLSISNEGRLAHCLGEMCAWYSQDYCGGCSIVTLADTADALTEIAAILNK